MITKKDQRNRNRNTFKRIKQAIFLLLMIIPFSYVFGSALGYMNTMGNYFMNEVEVSEDEFMDTDISTIQSAVDLWDDIDETYHYVSNLTGDGWDYYPAVDVYFTKNPASSGINNDTQLLAVSDPLDTNDPYNQISSYYNTGHGAFYSGLKSLSDAMRYAVYMREGKYAEAQNLSQNILHLVKGYDLLSAVTDGKMARFVVPNNQIAQDLFSREPKLFTDDYSATHLYYKTNYTAPNGITYEFCVEGGCSVDLYTGVLLGLGATYMFIDNTTIRESIRITVDRMLDYFIENGWRYIDADGKTHLMGAEALNEYPFTDSSYCMAFLAVGKVVNPEKWEEIYDYYAYERLLAREVGKLVQLGLDSVFTWQGSYFNINLMYINALTLCLFEQDPQLKSYYQKNILDPMYQMVRYHRNAWFDAAYALGMADLNLENGILTIDSRNDIAIDENTLNYIEKDVGDCLMRCALTKITGRKFRNPSNYDSYSTYSYLTPIENASYPDVQRYDWNSSVNMDNPIIALFAPLANPDNGWTKPYGSWDKPIPADWRRTTTFMWEYSCFDSISYAASYQSSLNVDFTIPFWIGEFLNFSNL